MKKMTTLRFIACWLCLCPLFCTAQDRYNDSLALVVLHNATDGTNWINKWNLTQPMDTWYGIVLDENGRVTCIDMDDEVDCGGNFSTSGNNLFGSIPPELGNLDNLIYLNLKYNELSGSIPPELGSLSNLETLYLKYNQLTGNIPPELGNISSLINLYLSDNQLTGNIPSELGSLSNLEHLYLSNNLLIGNIPLEIGNLSNLEHLVLYNNQLSGGIPPGLGSLSNLEHLNLKKNLLSGSIPPQLGSLSNLNNLNLSVNQLSGEIPSELSNLNMLYLDLQFNELSGNIPPELGNLNNVIKLELNNNQLSGSITPELGNISSLGNLDLSNNQLSGDIPPALANLGNLISLELHYNQLSGNIPPQLGSLSSLETLYLKYNQLTGNIPSELGNMSSLINLYLSNNRLSDTIPSELRSLSNLEHLYLSNNLLSGNIPDFSNLLPTLTRIIIDGNKFSFDDVQATYSVNNSVSNFQYSPQYHGEPQGYTQNFGDNLTLTLSEPLPGNNNQNVNYQWKKNYKDLAGSVNTTYTINNLQLSNVGEYTLHMTDPSRESDLEVISEPIYVIIPNYDLFGDSVVYNQIMMQFDNEADREFYKNEYLLGNGWERDSCNCNRGLYLWEFQSDATALQVLLDINTKTESQESKADIDGGPNNIFNLGVSNNSGTAWSWTGDYTGATYQDLVRVFMLDSGLDESNWDASPYLLPSAPKDNCYNIAAPGYDYTDSLAIFTTNYIDLLGHGTFGFRSIVEGLNDYMDIKSVPLKVFNQSGQGTLFKFVCALYHAIDHDADVINISAGYRGQPSEILAEAMQLAQQKGIFIVTAAGNDGQNIDSIPQFPAYFSGMTYERETDGNIDDIPYDNVISVASINAQDSLSVFSNYGSNNTTLVAYGENMSGYGVGGVNVISSGTSMSTFYVTRELAVEIAKDKNRTLQEIWSDFDINKLVNNSPTYGLTQTGKRLDIQIVNTCLPSLAPSGDISDGIYQAGQDIESDGTIPMGSSVQFKAGDMIILQPGFQIESQSEFSGKIENCDDNQ